MRATLLALLLPLQGCDCGFKPVTDCNYEGTCDAGPASCPDCVSTEVGWGYLGGFTAYTDSSSVTECQTFHHRRETFQKPPRTTLCEAQLTGCLARVNALLDDPIITGALSTHHLYGKDTRPVDGQVFQIDARGGWLEVGSCSPDCRPAAVKELQELLEEIEAQQLELEPCKGQFDP